MYYLFAYGNYYPGGGINDLKGKFDTIEDAVEKALELYEYWDYDNYQITNSDLKVVKSGRTLDLKCEND